MKTPLALVGVLLASLGGACSAPGSSSGDAVDESDLTTTDASVDAVVDAPVDAPVAPVAPYVDGEIGPTPKVRWSIAGAPPTAGFEVEQTTIVSGAPRRFRFQAKTETRGGLPAFFFELGRGPSRIETGVYDCKPAGGGEPEAVVGVVNATPAGTKSMTAVLDAPSRPCKIFVDQAKDMPVTSGGAHSIRRVLGRIEAEIGARDDAHSPTRAVSAAFAALVVD